jgi:membrane associated rhomboid family serine protease
MRTLAAWGLALTSIILVVAGLFSLAERPSAAFALATSGVVCGVVGAILAPDDRRRQRR